MAAIRARDGPMKNATVWAPSWWLTLIAAGVVAAVTLFAGYAGLDPIRLLSASFGGAIGGAIGGIAGALLAAVFRQKAQRAKWIVLIFLALGFMVERFAGAPISKAVGESLGTPEFAGYSVIGIALGAVAGLLPQVALKNRATSVGNGLYWLCLVAGGLLAAILGGTVVQSLESSRSPYATSAPTVIMEGPRFYLLETPAGPPLYYLEIGWINEADGTVSSSEISGPRVAWIQEGERLDIGQPITFMWTSPSGLTYRQAFEPFDDYVLAVTQQVSNNSDHSLKIEHFGHVVRIGSEGEPDDRSRINWPVVYLDGQLVDPDSASDAEARSAIESGVTSQGGWLGFNNRDWAVVLLPDQEIRILGWFHYGYAPGERGSRVTFAYEPQLLSPGATLQRSTLVYLGPSDTRVLQRYEDELEIPALRRAAQ